MLSFRSVCTAGKRDRLSSNLSLCDQNVIGETLIEIDSLLERAAKGSNAGQSSSTATKLVNGVRVPDSGGKKSRSRDRLIC